jgi:hypothetical protein
VVIRQVKPFIFDDYTFIALLVCIYDEKELHPNHPLFTFGIHLAMPLQLRCMQ